MRTLLAVSCAVAFLALLLGLAWRAQRTLELGLPPRDDVAANRAEGFDRARVHAMKTGGDVVGVLGTGSMVPYIPESRAQSPELRAQEIVAYAVTKRGATFEDVTPGAVCLYAHRASPVGVAIHGAAKRTRDGWIMSGLANARSDEWMTPETFRGIAEKVFVWK